eukprot:Skav227540  [mRNA]  locus=scaffold2241:5776:6354:+ [translate_table: standard]
MEGDVPAAAVAEIEETDHSHHDREDGDKEDAEPPALQNEMAEMQDVMAKACHDAGADASDDETSDVEYFCGDSEDEAKDFALVAASVQKVKTFCFRAAFKELEEQGLTSLPRHVGGCSISYHAKEQRWQGIYPGVTQGMSSSWGKKTNRSEKEAIVQVVDAVLTAHCSAFPKDHLWKSQMDKVKMAKATHKF